MQEIINSDDLKYLILSIAKNKFIGSSDIINKLIYLNQ